MGKGVAAWWAQGKISDDDFVSAIKFLVKEGIIKYKIIAT